MQKFKFYFYCLVASLLDPASKPSTKNCVGNNDPKIYVIFTLSHLELTQPKRTYLSIPSYSCVFIKESHERKVPAKVPEKKAPPPPKGK